MIRFNNLVLILFIIYLFLSFNSCTVENHKLFSNALSTSDSTYGYTPMNPLLIKNGDMNSSMESENYFLRRLTTVNNERLIFVRRGSFINPNGKVKQIMDEYTFVVENTKDTIRLYVNVYKKGIINVPMGLKYNP